MSVPRTAENDSGSWRLVKTPSAADAWSGKLKKDEFKFGNSGSLAQEVESGFLETHRMWPTPIVGEPYGGAGEPPERFRKRQAEQRAKGQDLHLPLSTAVRMWPTPTANEDACGKPTGKMQKMLGNHPDVRNTGTGTLNPTWVEWLMGWPLGQTDLKPLETDKFHLWLQQHGNY